MLTTQDHWKIFTECQYYAFTFTFIFTTSFTLTLPGPLEDLYGGRVCRGFPSEPRARGFHFREVERRQREVIVRFDYLMIDGSFDLTTL